MKEKVKLLLMVFVVGALVALTYYVFEHALSQAIEYVWKDLLHTDDRRFVIIPLIIVLTAVFFWLQHTFDPDGEEHESHGLGVDHEKTTLQRYGALLLIGFFSLLAGASLGPEAVLVPSCLVLGGLIAKRVYNRDKVAHAAAGTAAITALFAAFFHSFIVGIMATLLVIKLAKVPNTISLWLLSGVAVLGSVLTLRFLDPTGFLNTPHETWDINLSHLPIFLGLFLIGFVIPYAMRYLSNLLQGLRKLQLKGPWFWRSLIASCGLVLIYLLGGPLVQFTGNEQIASLFAESSELGYVGLIAVAAYKVIAIVWSKTMGYRGGMIFPLIFVLAAFIAVASLIEPTISFTFALIAGLAGSIVAESKAKVLF